MLLAVLLLIELIKKLLETSQILIDNYYYIINVLYKNYNSILNHSVILTNAN